jgi:hypothetical protein
MRRIIIFSLVILSLFLSGCIQSNTLIRVNPDGSGEVEETVLLSSMLVASMQNLTKKMTDDQSKDKDKDKGEDKDQDKKESGDYIQKQIKEAKTKIDAMGANIKFISATPVRTETMTGYKTIYSFRDINKLNINQNPSDKTGKPEDQKDASSKKKEMLQFSFRKGPVSILSVRMPDKSDTAKNEKPKTEQKKSPEDEAAAMDMMKMFFKDMAVRIELEMVGTVVKTNASYRDKSRITLIDMEFGKIFENKEVFEKLSKAQPKTIEEMKDIVKDIKGLRIELNNPVVVEFR